MCIGAILSLTPGKMTGKAGTVAAKVAGNFAVKEVTGAASTVAASKCSTLISWFSSSCFKRGAATQTAQMTVQATESLVVKEGMLHGAGCSVANAVRLKNSLSAREIAGSHAFEKHVLSQGEFPGLIRTREQFSSHIENI
jgi:hypothetical protein